MVGYRYTVVLSNVTGVSCFGQKTEDFFEERLSWEDIMKKDLDHDRQLMNCDELPQRDFMRWSIEVSNFDLQLMNVASRDIV